MIGLGLLGAGRIGQVHAANLAERVAGARLVRVCDPAEGPARALGERHRVPWTLEPEEVLADPEVEAVLICSATPTHGPLIQAAARAGKAIFCEKPLSLDLEEIDRALEAVAHAGVLLQVGFNRRFDAGVRRVKALAAEGRLGQLELLRITSRDPAPPPADYARVSGGIFLDMTIHDFDMARHLAASEAVELYAAGAVRVDPALGEAGDLDTAVITIRFANGLLATLDNSRRAVYGYDQRVELFGSAGCASTSNLTLDNHQLWDAAGGHRPRLQDFFMDRYAESFAEELRSFARAVDRGEEPEVGGWDGRQAVALGLAARRSIEQGGPVELARPLPLG